MAQEVLSVSLALDLSDAVEFARTKKSLLLRAWLQRDDGRTPVVVKFVDLRFLQGPDLTEMIIRGNALLMGLDHPHIIRSYGSFQHDGAYVLIMEDTGGTDMSTLPPT